jgi:predicted enzyme related to lactoylglutathione lyase
MHRSRLVAALIDVPEEHFEQEAEFWSGALGVQQNRDADDPDYADFGEVTPGFQFYVQRVGAPARTHLDIETDDVDAEVARLEALGATCVEPIRSWWVMRDPAGMLFCVVRVQLPEAFERHAREWP